MGCYASAYPVRISVVHLLQIDYNATEVEEEEEEEEEIDR